MSDDIDIKEHDILEDPRIKNMFPDISSIKAELDYDEEYIEVKKENFDTYQDMDMGVNSEVTSSILTSLKFESDLTKHCNTPNDIGFLKNSHDLLPSKFECEICDSIFDTKIALNKHKTTHNIGYYVCKICSYHFLQKTNYANHVCEKHGVIGIKKFELVPAEYECNFCVAILRDGDNNNKHILAYHPEMYNKVIDKDFKEYVSQVSNHKAIESMDDGNHLSNDVYEPKLYENIHFTTPISTLFECNMCKTNFISCSVAIEHEKTCDLKIGDWECTHCCRNFKEVDRLPHLQQHKLTEHFKTIKIKEDLYRLLYKCTKCLVCYNEVSLLKYHSKGCSDFCPHWIFCSRCKFRIHKNAFADHKRIHCDLGDEFIIIDIVCTEQMQIKNVAKKIQEDKTEEDIGPLSMHQKKFFYCNICQCYKKSIVGHDRSKCSKNSKTIMCELCGLRFTTINFNNHTKIHQKHQNLKLKDLIFFDIDTKEKINPPIPNFNKCICCSVHFFSNVKLKNHSCRCSAIEAKDCRYCGEKFTDLTYKLHVQFHEYRDIHSEAKECSHRHVEIKKEDEIQKIKRPKIIKKYGRLKSISNILFQCESCDTVLDFYDDVVEHCQDHLGNMNNNITINLCSICDLKFAGDCYEKHKKLHATSCINKSAFKILVYRYENLMSKTWYDIFSTLSNDQVDQILNKSKYKYDRSVRIKDEIDTRYVQYNQYAGKKKKLNNL